MLLSWEMDDLRGSVHTGCSSAACLPLAGTGPSTFIAPASPAATSISLVFENGTCSLPVSPTPDAPMPAGDAGGLPATSEPPAIGELAAAAPCRSLPPLPADAEPEPPTHPAEHAWMAPAEPAASRQLVVYGAWPGGIPPTGPASPAATSADGSFPGGMEPSGPAGPTPADVSDVPHTCGWVLGRRQPAGPAGPSPVDAEPAAAAQPAAASPAEPAASVKSTDPVGPPLPGVEAVSAAAFPQPAADFNAGPPATPGLTAADVGAEQASQPRAALPDTPVAGSDFDALVAEAKAAWAAMAQASGDASPAPISQDATDAPACTAAHIVTAVMRQAGSAADAAARAAARGVAAGLSKAGSAVGAAIRTAACSVVAGLGQGARAASAATCTAARSLSAALSEAGRAAGTASRTAARTLAAGISQAAHAAGAAARAIGHTLAAKLSQAGSVVRAAAGELVVASWHKMQAGRAWTSTQLATAGMHLRQWMLEAWASMRPDLPMALLHASGDCCHMVPAHLPLLAVRPKSIGCWLTVATLLLACPVTRSGRRKLRFRVPGWHPLGGRLRAPAVGADGQAAWCGLVLISSPICWCLLPAFAAPRPPCTLVYVACLPVGDST